MRRLVLALAAAGLALVVLEGALSLVGARTLRARFGPSAASAPGASQPAEEHAAEVFVPHPDPRVPHVLAPDRWLDFQQGLRSDALGLRARPDGAPADDAFRIALVGDSVVFGWGLADDEVLAARLEHHLREAAPAGARPVACRTVGLPGWNHWNSLSFLTGHLDRLRPDLVLFLPIPNDLSDTTRLYDTGRRQPADPFATDPWFRVAYNGPYLTGLMARRARGELTLAKRDTGPVALEADLSPESSRRYDAMARHVADTAALLASLDIGFALLPYEDDDFTALLLERLARLGPLPRVVPLVDRMTSAEQLAGDPHPDAATVDGFARWIAADLMEARLLPAGDGDWRPPAPSPELASRRAAPPDPDALAARADAARARGLELLGPRFVPATGHGAKQVYGGLHADGTVETRLLTVLRRDGDRLRVELEALPDRPDALPLLVEVLADGAPVGRLPLTVAVPRRVAVLDLPPGGPTVEIKLLPDRWVVQQHEGAPRLASFRLGAVAVLPD